MHLWNHILVKSQLNTFNNEKIICFLPLKFCQVTNRNVYYLKYWRMGELHVINKSTLQSKSLLLLKRSQSCADQYRIQRIWCGRQLFQQWETLKK